MSSVALRRPTADRKVAGVCAGMAQHWGVDPLLVRLSCVLLALSGGVGVVLYLLGWLLVVPEGRTQPPVAEAPGGHGRSWSREARVVLAVVGCVAALGLVNGVTPFGFGPAVVLGLVGILGWRQSGRPSTARQDQLPAPIVAQLPQPLAGPAAQPFVQPSAPAATALRPSRARSRPARRLRLVACVVLLLTQVGVGTVDRWLSPVPTAGYLATALLVLGLTLVAAAWRGRARGLLPLALLVLLATLVATVLGPVAQASGWQSQQVAYRSASQLTSGDQRRLGVLRVDLGQLAVTSDTSYRAHVDVGALVVTLPRDADVVVNWRVEAGAFLVNGQQRQGGPDLRGVERFPHRDPSRKTVVVDLSVDQGVVEVRR